MLGVWVHFYHIQLFRWRRDGVHLSDKGNDIFLEDVCQGSWPALGCLVGTEAWLGCGSLVHVSLRGSSEHHRTGSGWEQRVLQECLWVMRSRAGNGDYLLKTAILKKLDLALVLLCGIHVISFSFLNWVAMTCDARPVTSLFDATV